MPSLAILSVSGAKFNSATGGTVNTYTSGGVTYRSHTFTSTSTLTVLLAVRPFDVVAIGAGGGGGGSNNSYNGERGGPGTKTTNSNLTLAAGSHTVTVGTGGAGGDFQGFTGGTSSLSTVSGAGGGGGETGHGDVPGLNPTPVPGPTTDYTAGSSVEYGRGGVGAAIPTAPGGNGWNGVVVIRYRIG